MRAWRISIYPTALGDLAVQAETDDAEALQIKRVVQRALDRFHRVREDRAIAQAHERARKRRKGAK